MVYEQLKPYSYKRKGYSIFGSKYSILYENSEIRIMYGYDVDDVKQFVNLLNCAYSEGYNRRKIFE